MCHRPCELATKPASRFVVPYELSTHTKACDPAISIMEPHLIKSYDPTSRMPFVRGGQWERCRSSTCVVQATNTPQCCACFAVT